MIERFNDDVRLEYLGRAGTGIRTRTSLLQSKVIGGRIYKSGVTHYGIGTEAAYAAATVGKTVTVYQAPGLDERSMTMGDLLLLKLIMLSLI